MRALTLVLVAVLLLCQAVNAEVLFTGGSGNKVATAPSGAVSGGNAPRRHEADMSLARLCITSAPYCLVADSRRNRLNLFENGEGVMSWDIIMLPPRTVMRGYITEIDRNPSWCPPASVRRKFPGLPAGCLPPGHRLNAMGEVKIIMGGDFAGTAIRIHDTRAFGASWPNEDSSGCVRVLNLKTEVLPRIGQGEKGAVEVVFK